MKDNGMVRISVYVPKELYEEIKGISSNFNVPMRRFWDNMVAQYANESE
jgi:metal-responsive CopG/Arc/MetJ family transcriptional regulator